MVFVIGLTIKGVKYAYRTYQKHQAEKDMHARGVPHEIVDPSHELEVSRRSSSDQRKAPRPDKQSRTPVECSYQHSNASSSSLDSVSTTEAEERLRDDVEFQHFIKRQKQAYLSQRRADRGTGDRGAGLPVELPAQGSLSSPPPYEVAVAQDGDVGVGSSVRPQAARLLYTDDIVKSGGRGGVSPSSPRHLSAVGELDTSPVSSCRSSDGIICELPGDSTL